jgi:hypothetical protein
MEGGHEAVARATKRRPRPLSSLAKPTSVRATKRAARLRDSITRGSVASAAAAAAAADGFSRERKGGQPYAPPIEGSQELEVSAPPDEPPGDPDPEEPHGHRLEHGEFAEQFESDPAYNPRIRASRG